MEVLGEWSASSGPVVFRVSKVGEENFRITRLDEYGREVEGIDAEGVTAVDSLEPLLTRLFIEALKDLFD